MSKHTLEDIISDIDTIGLQLKTVRVNRNDTSELYVDEDIDYIESDILATVCTEYKMARQPQGTLVALEVWM